MTGSYTITKQYRTPRTKLGLWLRELFHMIGVSRARLIEFIPTSDEQKEEARA